jgi:hypothetical protein
MDRKMLRQHLAQAEKHIAQGKANIARRRELIAKLDPTLQTTARGQPPAGLGLRQTRSNGSRQAWGATS